MRPAAVGLSAFLVALGIAGPARPEQASETPPPAGPILTAPGRDTAKVIAFLRRIQEGAADAETRLHAQDILIKGALSSVTVPFRHGISEQTVETMPRPQWAEFTLVEKKGKRRLELETPEMGPNASMTSHATYCLMDGENSYRLDVSGKYLEILGGKDGGDLWRRALASSFFLFGEAHDGAQYLSLPKVCQNLIGRLDGTLAVAADYWKTHTVRCHKADNLLVIEFEERQATAKPSLYRFHYVFWIDPNKGYRVVKKHIQQRTATGALDMSVQGELEIQEVLPGIFVEKKASLFTRNMGSLDQKEGRAAWQKRDLEVRAVKVGDFEFDDALFDKSSLPVPDGARVVDSRYDPPREFIHGASPLDQELLLAALKQTTKRNLSKTAFAAVNVLLVAILAVVILKRRFRKGVRKSLAP